MFSVYLAPESSSMAPHIALRKIGEPFDLRPLSFARKENRAPAVMALNPQGRVPVLLVDGRPPARTRVRAVGDTCSIEEFGGKAEKPGKAVAAA